MSFSIWAFERLFYHVVRTRDPKPGVEEIGYINYWGNEVLFVWYRVYSRFAFMAGDWTRRDMFLRKLK